MRYLYFRLKPGWGGLLLVGVVLWGGGLSAQSPTAEELFDAGEYAAAARAFTERRTRPAWLAAGNAWVQTDSLRRARAAFAEVVRTAPASAPDSLTGLAHHLTGVAWYRAADDSAAVVHYRRALRVRDGLSARPTNDRAKTRKNLATSLRFLGRLDTAAALARQAVAMYEALPRADTTNWVRALNELGQIALAGGDRQLARDAVDRSEQLAPSLGAEDAFNLSYLGARISLEFGDDARAERLSQRAARRARTVAAPDWEADALTVYAGALWQQGRLAEARTHYTAAAGLLQATGDPYGSLNTIYLNLLSITSQTGDDAAADGYARKLAEVIGAAELGEQLRFYRRLGDHRAKQGRTTDAVRAYSAGLRRVATGRSAESKRPTPDLTNTDLSYFAPVAELLYARAKALRQLAVYDGAAADFDQYFTLGDYLRARVNSDNSRSYLSRDVRGVYDEAIDLAVHRFRTEENDERHLWRALDLSERARAYSLRVALRRDPAARSQAERELRARVAELERTGDSGGDLAAARLQLDRLLEADRREADGGGFTLNRDSLVAYLTRRASDLLVFHVGGQGGHVFAVNRDGGRIDYASFSEVDSLGVRTERWRAALTASAYRRKSLRTAAQQAAADAAFQRAGLTLTEQLFGGERWGGLPTGDLIIVPDGPLAAVPFACLPTRAQAVPLDYATYPYWRSGRHTSYAYSVESLLVRTERARTDYATDLYAFAPSFGGADDGAERGAVAGLAPLRFNAAEARRVAALVSGSRTAVGPAADRERFVDAARSSRILHLSTHGVANLSDPKLSFVVFTQRGDSLQPEEMLYFNDLSALPIAADLVVLSACQTSLGEYVPGETTLSLASAFAAAGARSTLTTLWSVDDEATKDLMVAFYEQLAGGAGRVSALARAQAAHRAGGEFSHPYYWAGLTLHGAGGPVHVAPAPGPRRWVRWLVALGVLLVVTGLVVRGTRKTSAT